MKVTVDAPRCVTSGQCVMYAPDVFDQDDEGLVVLLQDEPPEHLAEAVRDAAAICPAAVIEVTGS